jgi:predicted Zn-dependent peptidase
MKFKHQMLSNGLQVVAEVNPQAYSAAFGFFVNAGSRDETETNSGVSHFLEHMAFKGTPTRSAEDVNRQLDEMGSHSNARTGEERTIYHAAVLPEFQTPILELLCDLMRPSLRDDDFDVEKKVIVEEILMYDDQPPFGGHERIMAAYFGDHPLSRSILGTVDTVQALTPQAMREYFESRYSPDTGRHFRTTDSSVVTLARVASGFTRFTTVRLRTTASPPKRPGICIAACSKPRGQ